MLNIMRDIGLSDLSVEIQNSIVEEVKKYIINEYPQERGETEEEYEELTNERVDNWLNVNYDINIFEMKSK